MPLLNLKPRRKPASKQLCNINKAVERNSTEKEVEQTAAVCLRQESQKLLRKPKETSLPESKTQRSSSIPNVENAANKHTEKIRQLEKALEQSLNYLHELSQKLTEQDLLIDHSLAP